MDEVHVYPWTLRAPEGTYLVRAYADQQPDGLWEGWFAFFPIDGGETLATDRETTQSKRSDVTYWASGIGATYLEGALRRALDRRPEVQLLRQIARAEEAEAYASAEAEVYASAAAEARDAAKRAEAVRKRGEARLERG